MAAGLTPAEDPATSRKLIVATNRPNVSLVVLRATDVPTYVQYGACDIGIAGKDVLLEHGGSGLYQPLDLGIGRCRLVVATRRGHDSARSVQRAGRHRAPPKNVRAAPRALVAPAVHLAPVKHFGATGLAPP